MIRTQESKLKSRTMRRGWTLALAAVLVGTALSIVPSNQPDRANADVISYINGTQNTTGWYNYNTVRTVYCVSGRNIGFQPSNLFNQAGGGGRLEMRLMNATASAQTSQALAWTSTSVTRSFGNYAHGTQFRISTRGYAPTTGDTAWSGRLIVRIVSGDTC